MEYAEDLVSGGVTRLISRGAMARNPRTVLVTTALRMLFTERRRGDNIARGVSAEDVDNGTLPITARESEFDDILGHVAEAEDSRLREATLNAALRESSSVDRDILTACYLNDKSLNEYVAENNITHNAAKARLWRARERVRYRLEKEDGRSR
jgi:DNA-directed RNA polymerase specialized sigma24 family protein